MNENLQNYTLELEYGHDALEAEIAHLEDAMDIINPADRFLEACLFVDQKFVVASLLTESALPIERMFGDEAWAGYLQARLLTRDADKAFLLSSDFAIDLLLEAIDIYLMGPEGKIRGGDRLHGDHGQGGQFIDGQFKPLDLTGDQIEALNQQPWVSFLSANDPDYPNRGYIQYPILERWYAQSQFQAVFYALHNLKDGYEDAAIFQQHLIQLHLFESGMNGRVSRVGMNWRLERRDLNPSILEQFDDDLFTTTEEWINCIKKGSELYGVMRQRIDAGIQDPVDLLGLRDIKDFHDSNFTPSSDIAVPIFKPDAIHSHIDTARYLAEVERAYQKHSQSKKLGSYAYRFSNL